MSTHPQHMFLLRNKKDISIFQMKKNALSVAMSELHLQPKRAVIVSFSKLDLRSVWIFFKIEKKVLLQSLLLNWPV